MSTPAAGAQRALFATAASATEPTAAEAMPAGQVLPAFEVLDGALTEMVEKHGVQILRTPPEILITFTKKWDAARSEKIPEEYQ
jgi:hypothetical protein